MYIKDRDITKANSQSSTVEISSGKTFPYFLKKTLTSFFRKVIVSYHSQYKNKLRNKERLIQHKISKDILVALWKCIQVFLTSLSASSPFLKSENVCLSQLFLS